MAQIRLIVTDLDGTLLDEDGNVPRENADAIRRAASEGVETTICTGRMFPSAELLANELGLRLPLICYNGAMLRGLDGGIIYHKPLDLGIARKLMAFFRERRIHVQSYMDDALYVRDASNPFFNEYARVSQIKGVEIGDAIFEPRTPPTKLLAITNTQAEAEALASELSGVYGDDLYVTRSNANYVETLSPGVSKANGLSKLAESLDIPMDEIMAIGDGDNDAGMISLAGVGVALGNGSRAALGAADCVAPSNGENGVAWAIEKFVLSKRGARS